MTRRLSCALAVVLCLACPAFGDVAENFAPGGLEFGAKGFLTLQPDHGLFEPKEEMDEGDYVLFVEGGGSIGWFPIKNLSLSLQPSFFYWFDHSTNSMLEENAFSTLMIGLDLGIDYYLILGQSMALSFGSAFGLGIEPGIDDIDGGSPDEDNGFNLVFSVKPIIGIYWFITEHLAPYADIGVKLYYNRTLKDDNGDPYEYPIDYNWIEDVMTEFKVTIGLKYFLPTGLRAKDVQQDSFAEVLGSGMLK